MDNIDFNKLFNPYKEKIQKDTSEVDEIIEQEEILYAISKQIIKYRKEHHMTQNELSKKLNVNQTMISKLESGKYNATFKQIHKMSRKLVNSSELFIKILEEIIENIEKFSSVKVNTQMENEIFITYSEQFNDKKIVYLKDYKNKGDNKYEQYQSKYSTVG